MRGVGEQQLARRVDDRDGVFEVLDRRLEVGHLAGHLRSIGRQLRAHRVEERAELAELVVLIEVEPHAELAAAEPRQPAADHVDRPQQQLRRAAIAPKHRDRQRDAAPITQRRPERRVEIAAGSAASRRRSRIEPNSVSPSSSGSPVLEVLPLARIDRESCDRRRARDQIRRGSPPAGQQLPFERGIGVRDRQRRGDRRSPRR